MDRFPEDALKNQLIVMPGDKPCGEGGQACEAGEPSTNDKGERVVSVPKNLRQDQLVKVLQKYRCGLGCVHDRG